MSQDGWLMESVSLSPSQGKRKRYTVSHGGIWSYSHGVKLRKSRLVVIPRSAGLNASKRGDITTFSRKSADRLRRAILTLSHPDLGLLCGLTLTLPWQFDGPANARQLDAYKVAWNAYQIAFSRLCPHSALVFRHELQTRGAPHSHALLYLSRCDFGSFGLAPALAVGEAVSSPPRAPLSDSVITNNGAVPRSGNQTMVGADLDTTSPQAVPNREQIARSSIHAKITDLWGKALRSTGERWTRRAYLATGFRTCGVSVDAVRGHGQMAAYLSEHISKHKQAQLGYKGKQWGIIGRDNLREDLCGMILTDKGDAYETRILDLYGRFLSRMARYTTYAVKTAQKREKRACALFKNNAERSRAAYLSGFLPAWSRYGSKKCARRNAFCGVKWLSPDAQYRLFASACEQAAAEFFAPLPSPTERN